MEATDPAHGTLVLEANGSFTYTPSGSFSGQDTFTYQASDGLVDSNVATVTITVTDVNHAPVAQAQSVSVTEDGSTNITLAGTDADGDTLTYAIGTGPTHGSLGSIGTVGCSAGTCSANVTYTPDADYHGSDSFTFTVDDGQATSAAATVSITVEDVNDAIEFRSATSAFTNGATSLTIPVPAGVQQGDVLVAAIGVRGNPTITPPAGWTLVVNTPNGTTMREAVFVHVVGATAEPSSYAWTFSVSQPAAGGMAAYSGVNTAAPVDAFLGQANASSGSITAPSVNTSGPGDVLIGVFATAVNTTIAPPGSMIERAEAATTSGGKSPKVTLEMSDQLLGTSGATGTRVATAGAAVNIGTTIALRSAGALPPSAIEFRSATSAFTNGATSLTIPVPAGVQQGDVLVAAIGVRGNPTITPPAGWTLVVNTPNGTTMREAVFVHVVGATAEPSSYAWTFSVSQPAAGGMAAYSGVNTAAPVDAFLGQANASSGSITAPSVNTSGPGDVLIGVFATAVNTTIAPPGSMIERAEAATTSGGKSPKVTLEMSDQLLGTSGATGTRVATAGASREHRNHDRASAGGRVRPGLRMESGSTSTNERIV